jgi:putative iron-dependent peroxidase
LRLNGRVTEPQPVGGDLTPAAIFLVLTVDEGGEQVVRDLLADLSALVRAVGFRVLHEGVSCVAGIGAEVWPRLFDVPCPSGLHPFQELRGKRHFAPATPGDLLFHIRSGELGPCWELATLITDRLAGACRVLDDTHGFGFFDRRDLMGFVDGTENPTGPAAPVATLDAVGGSYVVVQKYLHQLTEWNALSTTEQELVIGRTKLENVELDDAVKPPTSHVALTTITEPDGTERKIVRANMPFGDLAAGEAGTYFIGYSATPDVTELMLRNMFLGDADGNTDRILDFSTAVTGGLFYAPPAAFLEDPKSDTLAEAQTAPVSTTAVAGTSARQTTASGVPTVTGLADGSLGIGNLTRSPT